MSTIDPVLAMIRQAKLPGFVSREQPAESQADGSHSRDAKPAAPVTASNKQDSSSADAILALVRAAGLQGFKCTDRTAQV